MAWGCGSVDWEKEMAKNRRPELPGEKTLADWKESQAASGRTEEVARAEGTGLAKDVLAASGGAFPASAEWHTEFASDLERVEVAEFLDGQGHKNRFAVYEQIGTQVPYYWMAEAGDADAVRATAKEVREVEGVLDRDDIEMSELGVEVLPPYERFHFRFLDDAPDRDWIRPCRYLFENANGSGFTVLWKKLPPQMKRRSSGEEIHWAGTMVVDVPAEEADNVANALPELPGE